MKAKKRKLRDCLRCGWQWFSDKSPKACANKKCRSIYYNKPYKI